MIYKQLGTTDLNVSVIGLGTWQLCGEWGKKFTTDEVSEILKTVESVGINLLDTAECYGNHLSESLIGSFIKRNRSNWILATKFGHAYKGLLDVEDRWSSTEVKQQLEDSLSALGTDYVDIYQFHSGDDKVFDNDELWGTLEKEKRMGKIRYLGISILEDLVLKGDLNQIYKAKERGVDIIQVRYNWLHREAEKKLIPECAKLELAILARQPLAYGYLSGKYDDRSQFPENDVRHWLKRDNFSKEMNSIEELRKRLGHSVDMAKWSVEWCLKNKNIGSVLVGCKTVEQVKNITKEIHATSN